MNGCNRNSFSKREKPRVLKQAPRELDVRENIMRFRFRKVRQERAIVGGKFIKLGAGIEIFQAASRAE